MTKTLIVGAFGPPVEGIRSLFDSEHSFTLEKARSADLSLYDQLTAAVIRDGVDKSVVTRDQVKGNQSL